jgi:hypothetical protein
VVGAHIEEVRLDTTDPVADKPVAVVQGMLEVVPFLVVGDVLKRLGPEEFVLAVVEGFVLRIY